MGYFSLKSLGVGVIIGIGVYKLWKTLTENRDPNLSQPIFKAECLFFTPRKLHCTSTCAKITASGAFSNNDSYLPSPCNNCCLKRLLYVLSQARYSLDICMCLITCKEICEVIIKVSERGVWVRIILDKHMSEDATGAQVAIFRQKYIPIKMMVSHNIMHNKFAIIDRETVITGSLNWTRQGFTGNYENVMIVNHKMTAHRYSHIFEALWAGI